jgi:hypothetical protein
VARDPIELQVDEGGVRVVAHDVHGEDREPFDLVHRWSIHLVRTGPAPAGASGRLGYRTAVPDGDGKVVIAGTGRAGTTLLVQVLTDLGLDTGFAPDAPIDPRVHAGLERAAEGSDSPRIVKSPDLSRRLGGLLDEHRVRVDHVIVPIRDLDVAAASRVRNTRYGADLHTWGGLLGTNRATHQRDALAVMFAELFHTIARYELPHTLLLFPRFTTDWEYTHRQLGFLAPDHPATAWRDALAARVDPALVHEEPLTAKERALTVAGTVYNRGILRPARGVKRFLRPER